jgi:hypothetical protein
MQAIPMIAAGNECQALVKRRVRVNDRLKRIRQKLRSQLDPLPRDFSDAVVILENDRILRSIMESASRELAEVERELLRVFSLR